jgi:hypothetical protein
MDSCRRYRVLGESAPTRFVKRSPVSASVTQKTRRPSQSGVSRVRELLYRRATSHAWPTRDTRRPDREGRVAVVPLQRVRYGLAQYAVVHSFVSLPP